MSPSPAEPQQMPFEKYVPLLPLPGPGGGLADRTWPNARIDHAPTSADFAPMIKKGRIAAFLHENDYIVEFRGAWKSEIEGKVVAYESEELANR